MFYLISLLSRLFLHAEYKSSPCIGFAIYKNWFIQGPYNTTIAQFADPG